MRVYVCIKIEINGNGMNDSNGDNDYDNNNGDGYNILKKHVFTVIVVVISITDIKDN